MIRPKIEAFFDPVTHTVSYVVSDPNSRSCAIIDPVLDFDPASGRTGQESVHKIIDYILGHNLETLWILETHAHADHLSASDILQDRLGGQTVIGADIAKVQSAFVRTFNLEEGFAVDGSQFDRLLSDGDKLSIGSLTLTALHTPGHTPACMTYLIENTAFVGDTLFMPDYGTARCDFPDGDAGTLFDSIQKIYALPDDTRIFLCHDYLPEGRSDYIWETTVGEQKQANIHVNGQTPKADFIAMRTARDKKLPLPKLIIPSVQINIRAGKFPPPEDNGVRYLKVPINVMGNN